MGSPDLGSSLVTRDRLRPSKIRVWKVANHGRRPDNSYHPVPGQAAVKWKGRVGSVAAIKSWSFSFPRAGESLHQSN